MSFDYNPQLDQISQQALVDETELMHELCALATAYDPLQDAIQQDAAEAIKTMRSHPPHMGVEQFIQQFGLKEKEAIALLCLAESLLRIPDSRTADSLINDKLKGANWRKFYDEHTSLFDHAQITGLRMSSEIASLRGNDGIFEKMVYSLGEPVLRKALKAAMHVLGNSFVAGKTIKDAFSHLSAEAKKGYDFSFDMLGEGARTQAQADAYYEKYERAITEIAKQEGSKRHSISIKLSALHARYKYAHKAQVMAELYPRVRDLCLLSGKHNIALSIDSEEARRLDLQCELFAALLHDEALKDCPDIGFVLQAYQKRALPVIALLKKIAKNTNRRIPVRLVKGAYWDSEITWAQMDGLPSYPVFTNKEYTDVSYLACAATLLDAGDAIFPQFATHNVMSAMAVKALAKQKGREKEFEFQRLFGMGVSLYNQLIGGYPCRIYAPVGAFDALLPYLIRRLMENGANGNFVNQVMNPHTSISELTQNPLELAKAALEKNPPIPLPQDIFSNRKNSLGYELGLRAHYDALHKERSPFLNATYEAHCIINGEVTRSDVTLKSVSPANLDDVIGECSMATSEMLKHVVSAAKAGATEWAKQDAELRATTLEKAAELLYERRHLFYTLLAREAGKTIEDAIAEVREAEDFCRYYAVQARALAQGELCESYTGETNLLHYRPKGVAACISPWNFPLAIFVGQVVAALVAGNSVVAKASEHTAIIAYEAVRLLHEAGVSYGALQYVIAEGADFGKQVIADDAVSVVAFTGSTQVARTINRTLAAREGALPKLIAETGGQNCMVVDSSALLEQATDDIIHSAFGSAGQRCSALRVLFIQDEIMDTLVPMITGAMKLLHIGDPLSYDTDVPPVISKTAYDGLQAHIDEMRTQGKLIYQCEMPEHAKEGLFVAPALCRLDAIDELKKEHFGPILHIVPFRVKEFNTLIEQINSTGYGLTFGMHSRVSTRIARLKAGVKAGNLYINRSMTGAVVGVQPFGGMGLSGTGPKAGGANYLKAFMNEQVITENIVAIGGNMELLH